MNRFPFAAFALLITVLPSSLFAQSDTSTSFLPELEPITVENTSHLEELAAFEQNMVFSLAWSSDSRILAVNSFDDIWLYDLNHLDTPPRLIPGEFVRDVEFSPDGLVLASGDMTNVIKFWHVETGNRMVAFEGHENGVNKVVFSPDGTLVASVDGDCVGSEGSSECWPTENNTLRLWDAASGEQLAVMQQSGPTILDNVIFTPDSSTVLMAANLVIRGWEMNTLIDLAETDETTATLVFYDMVRGLPLGSYGAVQKMVFSPDQSTLALCGTEGGGLSGFVWLWNMRTEENKVIYGGYDHITDVSFSSDGALLAFSELQGVVHLWDIDTDSEIMSEESGDDSLVSAVFSPDGMLLATGSRDGIIRLWGVPAS